MAKCFFSLLNLENSCYGELQLNNLEGSDYYLCEGHKDSELINIEWIGEGEKPIATTSKLGRCDTIGFFDIKKSQIIYLCKYKPQIKNANQLIFEPEAGGEVAQ